MSNINNRDGDCAEVATNYGTLKRNEFLSKDEVNALFAELDEAIPKSCGPGMEPKGIIGNHHDDTFCSVILANTGKNDVENNHHFGTLKEPKNLYEQPQSFGGLTEDQINSLVPKEASPDGKSANQPGVKLDAGKIPVFRGLIEYFPHACMAVAEVSQAGANKYTWKGWIDVPNGKVRYTDALVRHLIKESTEGEIDPDFGLLHAAHLAWSALARLELILLEKKNA